MGILGTLNDFVVNVISGRPSEAQIAAINKENSEIQRNALALQGKTAAEIEAQLAQNRAEIARFLKSTGSSPVSGPADAFFVALSDLTGNFFGLGPSADDPRSALDKFGTLVKWLVVGGGVIGVLYFGAQFFKVVRRK